MSADGRLRQILETAVFDWSANQKKYTQKELTVLALQNDPYRRDTPSGHRNAKWFAEMVARFVPSGTIHLRGMHYKVSTNGGIWLPDNSKIYINDDPEWLILQETAKDARWLGYVPFARIVDERNAPPEIFVPEKEEPDTLLTGGTAPNIPYLDSALPHLVPFGFTARQPYRIVLFGEKSSLREVLLPVAQRFKCELLLPTGETSDTMIAELAARAADDGRPLVVLYFSDFDMSGWQMPISVARKLQAMRDQFYPELEIQLHPVALTLKQVLKFDLPETPLKDKDKRKDDWIKAFGREQTEIDALLALYPDTLAEIAIAAIEPFYDPYLEGNVSYAEMEWREKAEAVMQDDPVYRDAVQTISELHDELLTTARKLENAQADAEDALRNIEAPPIVVPEPDMDISKHPKALFSSKDHFITTSIRLKEHKAYASGNGDGE